MSKLIYKRVKPSTANPLRTDPSQTGALRRLFSQGMNRQINELQKKLKALVVEQNAFGLGIPIKNVFCPTGPGGGVDPSCGKETTTNTRWQFNTTSQQVTYFLQWLQNEMKELFYKQETDSWWLEYIKRGWQQGAKRAYDAWKTTGKNDLLSAFNQPVSLEKVKVLAGRVLTELQGVTQAMATDMSRVLVDGLTRGDSPREVGKALADRVDKIGRNRANTIAQTETVRAHAEGQLDMLELVGMQNVGVMVEWSTSHLGKTKVTESKNKGTLRGGNPSPCSVCKPMEGTVFTIQEARGMIPRHPNCRCSFIPAGVGESTKGQKLGTKQISSALDASIKAEIPATTKKTLAEQKENSNWVGSKLSPTSKKETKLKQVVIKDTLEQDATLIYDKMEEVELGAARGSLVSFRDLRTATKLSKERFDKAVYDLLSRQRTVSGHNHDYAASLSPEDLATLVDTAIGDPKRISIHPNNGRYLVGIARKVQH